MLQEERYKELSAYLPGLQPDMPAQYQKLAEIFQSVDVHFRFDDTTGYPENDTQDPGA